MIGGQFGSEGKGKVAAHIASSEGIDICVRCGGPNSGHSFIQPDGSRLLLRQIPTGVIRSKTRVLIPAGGLIDLEVLRTEIEMFSLDSSRVGVDRNAMVIEPSDRKKESALGLRDRISSTLSGVGSAVSRRALRGSDVRLARDLDFPWLKSLITDVAAECNTALDEDRKVLIEGTQGFGLSLYHSSSYPKTTSRDTSAAGFLSEVGLSPLRVDQIVAVFRTFPIRVAGDQAGPLYNETTWEAIERESGYPRSIREFTTVTNKLRRVGEFDWDLARYSTERNRPTRIAVMGFDYLDYGDFGKHHFSELGPKSMEFVRRFESTVGDICYLGTGPGLEDLCSKPETSDAVETAHSPLARSA